MNRNASACNLPARLHIPSINSEPCLYHALLAKKCMRCMSHKSEYLVYVRVWRKINNNDEVSGSPVYSCH